MLSFKGILVKPTSVLQDYSYVITTNRPTSFVELNPYDKDDAKAADEFKRRVGNYGRDASLINDVFQYEGKSTTNMNSRYFALTEQGDDFEKIKSSAILGIVKTTNMDRDNVFIDMLQVNPWYAITTPKDTFYHPNRTQYRHCGTSSIDSLKEIFTNKNLWLHSPIGLTEFFKRLGFEIINVLPNNGNALMKFNGLKKIV